MGQRGVVTHPLAEDGNRQFDSGLSHHPACPCREVVFFLSSFPARRMPGIWGGSSVEEQRPAKPWPQVRSLSIPPALCVGRRVSLLLRLGVMPHRGKSSGLVIPGCPYTDPSGHGLPLVRAPSEFTAPRIHHGSVVPAEGPPNFIHPNQSQDTPERRGRSGRNPATKGPFFCVLVRRLNRKVTQRQKPSGSVMARRTRWEWFQSHGFFDALCPPIRKDLSNGMVSSSRETNNSLMHARACPRRAESRYHGSHATSTGPEALDDRQRNPI